MDSIPIAMRAPAGAALTAYDRAHFLTYARLLDAEGDWKAVARHVLDLDVDSDETGARGCYASHLDRARWIEQRGLDLAFGGFREG